MSVWKREKKRYSTSSSAKMSLLLFSLNEKAINWRGDNLEKKEMISLSFSFPFLILIILYCRKDYTKKSFLVYTIKCVFLCVRVCAHTQRHLPCFSPDWCYLPTAWPSSTHAQYAAVCARARKCSFKHTHTYTHINVHTHGRMHTHCFGNKAVLAQDTTLFPNPC